MALSARICKAELNVIDMDRHYYQQHSLTLAQHPSETDERLMVRLLVFALQASDSLSFTKGLSTDDEPDQLMTAAETHQQQPQIHMSECSEPTKR